MKVILSFVVVPQLLPDFEFNLEAKQFWIDHRFSLVPAIYGGMGLPLLGWLDVRRMLLTSHFSTQRLLESKIVLQLKICVKGICQCPLNFNTDHLGISTFHVLDICLLINLCFCMVYLLCCSCLSRKMVLLCWNLVADSCRIHYATWSWIAKFFQIIFQLHCKHIF